MGAAAHGHAASPGATSHQSAAHHGATMSSGPVVEGLRVDVGRPRIMKLSRPASGVIVGDPDIADVAVYTTDTLLILGRSYGATHVIAVDGSGAVIANEKITVREAKDAGTVRVHLGSEERNSYSCLPDCRPAPSLGDSAAFQNAFREPAPQINNSIVTSASTPGLGAPQRSVTVSESLDFDDDFTE